MTAPLYGVLAQTGEAITTPEVAWSVLAPNLILIVGGILLLTVVSLFKNRLPGWFHAAWAIVVALAAMGACVPLWDRVRTDGPTSALAGAVGMDGFSLFLTAVICLDVVLGALLLAGYVRRERLVGAEWYVLLLLSAAGGVTMASANDLIVVFIGLEILSVPVYVLAAMHPRRISSQEAGLKYFVLGAFASAFLLYGIALTYGATGSTNLAEIQRYLSETVITEDALLMGALAFLLVGFGFKIAAVPFHFWTPDVYQGAPTPVTAYMATAVKVAGFAALLRVFVVSLGPTYGDEWEPLVQALCLLTLIVGALLAVVQTDVKRMLAYSSINHAGFVLLGVLASSPQGTSAALWYLLAYSVMAAGSFGVVLVVARTGDGHTSIDDFRGLSRTRPGLALVFAVFLLAQAGVPLTAGFLAKLQVITAAVEADHAATAVVAMLTAVVSAFVYLRVVVAMYFGDAEAADGAAADAAAVPRLRIPAATGAALALALAGTLLLGVVPGPVTSVTDDATAELVAPPR